MKRRILFLLLAAVAFAGIPSGTQITYFGTAEGTLPLYFQWKKDGVPIPGAVGPTFVIIGSTPNDSGAYTMTATNIAGTAESPPDHLVVDPVIPPPPPSPTAPFNVRITGLVVTGPAK